MPSAPLTQALEWRIAWRHLRVGDKHPRWVDILAIVAVFMLVVGFGFVAWAAHLGPAPEPGEQLFSAAVATAQQRNFGVFGGLSIAIGTMLLVLAALARFFNLLATIITMSVLLGCMALVVVLSLMSGLEGDLRDKILNQKAHLRVSAANGNRFTDYESIAENLVELPEVAGASPYLEAEIMIRSGINRQGAVLLGVEPDRLLTVSNIADIMKEGSFDALEHPESIPDADPFGLSGTQTPWRLRHLDKDKDLRPKIQKSGKGKSGKGKSGKGKSGKGKSKSGKKDTGLERLPPPPPEIIGGSKGLPGPFGPSGLPGFAQDDADEGWQDPVEVLGLDEEDEAEPEPEADEGEGDEGETGAGQGSELAAPPTDEEGEDDWGGDDGWEDPEEVLDLGPEDESGEEAEDGGEEAEDGGDEADDGGEDEDPEDDGEDEVVEGVVDPILLGRELANELAVSLGARVQLITPVGRLTPAGRVPGMLATKVGGVFHSGMYEYDRKNVYTPLPVAQAFLRTGDRISGIEVKLHDVEAIDQGKAAVEGRLRELGRASPYLDQTVTQLVAAVDDDELRASLERRHGIDTSEPQLIVESWKELNRNLFSAMFLEKIAMFVALLFVVLVASFGILASNLMSVLEKSKEIAILKAMGSQDQLIQRVFVAEGLVLGLLGAVGGISVGLGLCWALDTFGFPFNENVYYIERLPVVVNPVEVAIVGLAALVIVWLSSLYPARVASRMRPVDGLRQQEK